MRFLALALALAFSVGCTIKYTAAEDQKRERADRVKDIRQKYAVQSHWTDKEVEDLAAGNIWVGMTETQLECHVKYFHGTKTWKDWHELAISETPRFRIYRCYCKAGPTGSIYFHVRYTVDKGTVRLVDYYYGG
jgi:hypothetical protein